ncbi:MAG: glycosyltransferase family 2 protein [Nanoarchaeota archaeon]
MQPRIVVTIPAYNEEKNLGKVISSVKEEMTKQRYNYRILVVDDGSTDKTAAVAKRLGAIVRSHPKNYGLAETFKTEIETCLKEGFDIIVHFDADGQYSAAEIPKLIREVQGGADLVLGSRIKGTIEDMPAIKLAGNKAFSRVVSNISGLPISDAQTGFRAFTKEVAQRIPITSNYTYTQEQIIRAAKAKFRIVEVPAHFAKRDGQSRLMRNPFHFALRAGVNLIRIWRDYEPLRFFGWIGAISMIIGLILGLPLLYLYITTGTISSRVPTAILSAVFILTGVQIVLFGFLADMRH